MKKIRMICISAAMIGMMSSTTCVQAAASSLDIEKVVNTAIESSYDIKKIDISIQQTQNSLKNDRRGEGNGNDLNDQYSIYKYTNLKEVTKNYIKLNLYTQYISFMNNEEALNLEQENSKNAEAKYKKTQLQFNLGTVAKADVKTSEQAYNTEKASLNKAQRSVSIVEKAINQALGVDINTQYTGFAKDIAVANPQIKTYNDYLNDALKNRAEILNDTENLRLRKLDFTGQMGGNPYITTPSYTIAKNAVAQAQNDLDTAKIDISIEINGLYNTLQTKMQALKPKVVNYNAEKKKYDQAQQKYNLGMISSIDFQDEVIKFKGTENALKTAQRDVALAKMKIEFASGIGANITQGTN